MTNLDRNQYIKLVEEDYFGNVAKGNIDKVLTCFTDDTLVTIRHGDNPIRVFNKPGNNGTSQLLEFYKHLCGNYTPWFGDFIHYIDVEEQRCACTFTVKLDPKEDSDYFVAGKQTLRNCNFFTCKDGKISEMTIYYSNTESGLEKTPTGYPKENWKPEDLGE